MPGFANGTMYSDNVDFTGSNNPSPQVLFDGQILIGSTSSPHIKVGALSSSDGSITWTVGSGTISGKVTASIRCIVTKYTANGTFIKNSSTTWIEIYAVGGGGGGGSGRQGATNTNRSGGGGGSGGQLIHATFDASYFNANGETVIIGGTANGGNAQSSVDSNGLPGTVGNNSSIGSIIIASGGNFGAGGTTTTGTGGSLRTAYIMGGITAPIAVSGGNGSPTAGGTPIDSVLYGGGTGGGGGGGINSSNAAGTAGAGASITNINLAVIIAGGTAGISGGAGAGAGNSASSANYYFLGGAGGGGGAATAISAAGSGNNGGTPGGGGGGGSASLNGNNSGAGGNGARGEIWVIEHL